MITAKKVEIAMIALAAVAVLLTYLLVVGWRIRYK